MSDMSVRNCGECVRLKNYVVGAIISDNVIEYCGVRDFVYGNEGENGEGIYVGTSSKQVRYTPFERQHDTHNVITTRGAESVDILTLIMCSYGMQGCYKSASECAGVGVRIGGWEVDGYLYGRDNNTYVNSFTSAEMGAMKLNTLPQGIVCGNSCDDGPCILLGDVTNSDSDVQLSWDQPCDSGLTGSGEESTTQDFEEIRSTSTSTSSTSASSAAVEATSEVSDGPSPAPSTQDSADFADPTPTPTTGDSADSAIDNPATPTPETTPTAATTGAAATTTTTVPAEDSGDTAAPTPTPTKAAATTTTLPAEVSRDTAGPTPTPTEVSPGLTPAPTGESQRYQVVDGGAGDCDPVPLLPSYVTASTNTQGENPAVSVVDRTINNRWSAEGDGSWFSIELPEAEVLSGVKLWFEDGDERQRTFSTIRVGAGGDEKVVTQDEDSSMVETGVGQVFPFQETMSIKSVMFVGYGNTINDWNSVNEIQLCRGQELSRKLRANGRRV
ncbi:unnamed protein product [Pylaiella littoralis]